MPINISKIVEKTQEITGGSTELELSRVAEIANIIEDSSVYSVPTTSNLPTAANNTGRFAYVDDQCRYYYSNGTSWTDDYVTTDLTSLQIWMSGINNSGQAGTNDTCAYSTPTQEACGGNNWCMVSGGEFLNASAIKTDGTLWSWGSGILGQLGTNENTSYSTPQQEFCGGTNWCAVSNSCNLTSAIKTDGTLWSWGANCVGQLGLNTCCFTCGQSTPQQEFCGGTTWCMVSASIAHISAIKTDGTLWSWGGGGLGRLGTNNAINYSTPQQEVCGGTTWCMVDSGGANTSAIKTDGTLWSWGWNNSGQLGLNNAINYSTPQQEVCGGNTWCMVSAGCIHTSAIKTDGTLWSWGNNCFGRLGTNNITNYSTPQQEVCGGTTWCMVSCGNSNIHVFAIKTDGTLWGWGGNSFGQLGTNDTICYSTPTQEICGFTDWIQPYLRGTIDTSGF